MRAIARAITHSLTRKPTDPGVGGGGAFDPASIIGAGDNGLAFTASPSTTFTDTAGTTPATANAIVKALRADAGTVSILTQATDASCLRLRGTPQGANLLGTNGDLFTAGSWILGAGWAITDGMLVATAATSDAVLPSVAAVNGKVYHVRYVVTASAGTVAANFGGVGGRARSNAGPLDDWITAGSTDTFRITGAGFTGTVSQIRLYAADAADVAAPYFLSGAGAQWLEASLAGFSAYPISMAGDFGHWSDSGAAALFSVYEGFSDCKVLNHDRAVDWDGGSVVSGYTGGAYQGVRHAVIADFGANVQAEAELIAGGAAANANAFGTKSNIYIGRGRPDIWYVDGRIYGGVLVDRAFTADEKVNLRSFYKADHAVQCWGDSMTAGSGTDIARSYPLRLRNDLCRVVENQGAGGETSTQIKNRFVADTTRKDEWIQILWMGTNDSPALNTWQPTLDNIATCVAGINGSARYLVLGVTRGDGGGISASELDDMDALLLAEYGDRFVDIRAYLQSFNDGSGNDLADIVDGLVPRSLRSDAIHLNDKGYQLVANCIHAKLDALGWA